MKQLGFLLLGGATYVHVHGSRAATAEGAAATDRVRKLELEVERLRADLSKARQDAARADPVADISPGKQWGIKDAEGGSDKTNLWDEEKGGSAVAYAGAVVFVLIVGSLPLVLHFGRPQRPPMVAKTTIVESTCLYVWLIGGLYLFTNVLLFQSPHFNGIRSLSLEESVYLFSQILTTVGYGDITPAKVRGQVFVGIFVFMAVMLIANMVSELLNVFEERMEVIMGMQEEKQNETAESNAKAINVDPEVAKMKVRKAFKPVIAASGLFLFFVFIGTMFFHFFPGENKTVGQGIYMSFITLSSVGFGAFTPTTHTGMVFGAFWMLFGVGALGGVITSYAAFSKALKHSETIHTLGEDTGFLDDTGPDKPKSLKHR